jgi:hypothetical protein
MAARRVLRRSRRAAKTSSAALLADAIGHAFRSTLAGIFGLEPQADGIERSARPTATRNSRVR